MDTLTGGWGIRDALDGLRTWQVYKFVLLNEPQL